jgi:ribosome-binding protein aMBF1 (putative translation factor)
MTTDAVKILHNLFIKDDPERLASLKEERIKLDIATLVYDLRGHMGLSQVELAKLLGTTEAVISRLEDTDY